MSNTNKALILIIVVVLLAIYIVLPNSPGIPIGENPKKFVTRLGLDLVGGVQALLEADMPSDADIRSEAMRTATTSVENRVNGLGVNEAVVQQAGDRRIVVELPGETDPEAALAVLRQTGLLEFVDLSELTQQEIQILLNSQTKLNTDFGLAEAELSAPLSTRHFANVPDGEIYGIAHTPPRFQCRALQLRTPVQNLFLTGQDAAVCGVTGALMGAGLTASVLLRRNLLGVIAKSR